MSDPSNLASTIQALLAASGLSGAGTFNGTVGGTTPSTGAFTYVSSTPATTLTAAGTNRATALQLAAQINNLTTVASGTGAALPNVAVGTIIFVFNNGANAAQIYSLGSATIDGVAGSTGVPLTNAKRAAFFLIATDTWISAQLGVVSA